jgi:hypothetical protein
MCARVDAIARANPGARILLVVGAAHAEDMRDRFAQAVRHVTN